MDILDAASSTKLSSAARLALKDSIPLYLRSVGTTPKSTSARSRPPVPPGETEVQVGVGSYEPSVDLKVDGSDGPITLKPGQGFVYSWTSSSVKSCQLTSPTNSGIATSGTSELISPSHPFYPPAGGTVVIAIECSDGLNKTSDAVTVRR
jgi:hypothetical protein